MTIWVDAALVTGRERTTARPPWILDRLRGVEEFPLHDQPQPGPADAVGAEEARRRTVLAPPRTSVEHVVERRTRTGGLIQRLMLECVGATTYVASLEARRT